MQPALIVDADTAWREHLLLELSKCSVQARTAVHADAALEALEDGEVSVALLDAPALTPELLEALELREIPLVILTHTPAEALGPLLARPGVYYLPKMASPRHLELLLQGLEVPAYQDAVA